MTDINEWLTEKTAARKMDPELIANAKKVMKAQDPNKKGAEKPDLYARGKGRGKGGRPTGDKKMRKMIPGHGELQGPAAGKTPTEPIGGKRMIPTRKQLEGPNMGKTKTEKIAAEEEKPKKSKKLRNAAILAGGTALGLKALGGSGSGGIGRGARMVKNMATSKGRDSLRIDREIGGGGVSGVIQGLKGARGDAASQQIIKKSSFREDEIFAGARDDIDREYIGWMKEGAWRVGKSVEEVDKNRNLGKGFAAGAAAGTAATIAAQNVLKKMKEKKEHEKDAGWGTRGRIRDAAEFDLQHRGPTLGREEKIKEERDKRGKPYRRAGALVGALLSTAGDPGKKRPAGLVAKRAIPAAIIGAGAGQMVATNRGRVVGTRKHDAKYLKEQGYELSRSGKVQGHSDLGEKKASADQQLLGYIKPTRGRRKEIARAARGELAKSEHQENREKAMANKKGKPSGAGALAGGAIGGLLGAVAGEEMSKGKTRSGPGWSETTYPKSDNAKRKMMGGMGALGATAGAALGAGASKSISKMMQRARAGKQSDRKHLEDKGYVLNESGKVIGHKKTSEATQPVAGVKGVGKMMAGATDPAASSRNSLANMANKLTGQTKKSAYEDLSRKERRALHREASQAVRSPKKILGIIPIAKDEVKKGRRKAIAEDYAEVAPKMIRQGAGSSAMLMGALGAGGGAMLAPKGRRVNWAAKGGVGGGALGAGMGAFHGRNLAKGKSTVSGAIRHDTKYLKDKGFKIDKKGRITGREKQAAFVPAEENAELLKKIVGQVQARSQDAA